MTTITSIWGLDTHDANSLLAGIGRIQDVAIASDEEILRKTDLSVEKARIIVSFFNSLRLLVIKMGMAAWHNIDGRSLQDCHSLQLLLLHKDFLRSSNITLLLQLTTA